MIALDRETFDWFAAMPGNVLRQDGPGASSVALGDGPGHIVFAHKIGEECFATDAGQDLMDALDHDRAHRFNQGRPASARTPTPRR